MTWRRLGVLVRTLPAESLTARALAGERGGWTQEMELLASIYDRLSQQVWQNTGKASAPKPKPFPRPGAKQDRRHRTALTPDQIAARLSEQQRREAQREVTCGR